MVKLDMNLWCCKDKKSAMPEREREGSPLRFGWDKGRAFFLATTQYDQAFYIKE